MVQFHAKKIKFWKINCKSYQMNAFWNNSFLLLFQTNVEYLNGIYLYILKDNQTPIPQFPQLYLYRFLFAFQWFALAITIWVVYCKIWLSTFTQHSHWKINTCLLFFHWTFIWHTFLKYFFCCKDADCVDQNVFQKGLIRHNCQLSWFSHETHGFVGFFRISPKLGKSQGFSWI